MAKRKVNKKNKRGNKNFNQKIKEKRKEIAEMKKQARRCYQETMNIWQRFVLQSDLETLRNVRDNLKPGNPFRRKVEREIKKRKRLKKAKHPNNQPVVDLKKEEGENG